VGAGTGITVNADDVALTVPVTVANGGTAATTAAAARTSLGVPADTNSALFGTVTVRNSVGGDGLNLVGNANQGQIVAQGASADISLVVSSKGNGSLTFYNANFGRVCAQFGSAPSSDTFVTFVGGAALSQLGNNPAGNPLYITSLANLTAGSTVPTPTAGDNSTKIATTAFVATAIGSSTPISTVAVQKFTASGTYTPTAGMKFCIIECIGGGGGGGGVTGGSGQIMTAGGGGSGGYSRTRATAATIGASKAVTIGAGGAGGPTGTSNGSAGGATSLGAICIANGGAGGQYTQTGVQSGAGGAGGTAGTGDIAASGSPGGSGFYNTSTGVQYKGGQGGSSAFGGAAAALPASGGAGASAGPYGGGGGGASDPAAGNAYAGGSGSAGIVFVTEYI